MDVRTRHGGPFPCRGAPPDRETKRRTKTGASPWNLVVRLAIERLGGSPWCRFPLPFIAPRACYPLGATGIGWAWAPLAHPPSSAGATRQGPLVPAPRSGRPHGTQVYGLELLLDGILAQAAEAGPRVTVLVPSQLVFAAVGSTNADPRSGERSQRGPGFTAVEVGTRVGVGVGVERGIAEQGRGREGRLVEGTETGQDEGADSQ